MREYFPWADHDDELRRLWAEGYSAAKIGNTIGANKNSVIGRVHRLKLQARPSPIKFVSIPMSATASADEIEIFSASPRIGRPKARGRRALMRTRAIFTPETDALIRGLRDQGISWETMSQTIGYTAYTLMEHAKALGIPKRRATLSVEDRARIAEMVRKGFSNTEIADALGGTGKAITYAAQKEAHIIWPDLRGTKLTAIRYQLGLKRIKAEVSAIPAPKSNPPPQPRSRGFLLPQYIKLQADRRTTPIKRKCLGNFCTGTVFVAPTPFIRLCGTCRSHA